MKWNEFSEWGRKVADWTQDYHLTVGDEGFYQIAVDAGADASGFTLTATAVASGPQADDTTTGAGDCTKMKLSSTGVKEGPVGKTPISDDCW